MIELTIAIDESKVSSGGNAVVIKGGGRGVPGRTEPNACTSREMLLGREIANFVTFLAQKVYGKAHQVNAMERIEKPEAGS